MELFRLMGTIAIDTSAANRALDDTTETAKQEEKELKAAFTKIGDSAKTVAKGIVTAGAALGGAFIAAIEGTREYRVSMGKLETAFTTSGHSADTARSTYETLNSVLGDSDVAVEAANHLAKLVDNEKDMNTWTNICTGVFATFGDSLPIEGLTEAANETAKTGQLTGGLTDALNWAGESEDEFQAKLDACSTEQERQQLITSTLNNLYSESAETYKKNNKELIEAEMANGRLKDAMAMLGAVGEPILTAIKTKIADMVTAAVPMIENLIQKFKDMKKWVQDNENKVDAFAAVLIVATTTIGGFVLAMKFSAIMASATKAIQLTTIAIKALNVAMKANIIGIIVSLIIGLVAAFVMLWKNNESFRNFWIGLWEKVKTVCSNGINIIKSKFGEFKKTVADVKARFEEIKSGITEKINAAKDAVKNAIEKIKGWFNTTLKFKGIKLPVISLTLKKGSGLAAKAAEALGLKGVPSFGLKWNAEGAILKRPVIFGMNGTQLLGGGESGDEAIAPIDKLQDYVSQAVIQNNNEHISAIENQVSRLISFLSGYFPKEYTIMLETGVLAGQLAPEMDSRLADLYKHNLRGNTR